MAITAAQAKELVNQVRDAHRLSVGFYQRFLPALDNFAAELGCQFVRWSPGFSRPSTTSKFPDANWKWDLLPMALPFFQYQSESSGEALPGEFCIEAVLQIDPILEKETRVANGMRGEPDPLALIDIESNLEIRIYRVRDSKGQTLDHCYDHSNDADREGDTLYSVGEYMDGALKNVNLAEFISEPERVRCELLDLLGTPPSSPSN